MSPRLIAYVEKHSKLKGSARAVLLAIARRAMPDGTGTYPGVKTIARDSGWNGRTVQRALRIARNSGELAINYSLGPHGTNVYRIRLENIGCEEDRQAASIILPTSPCEVSPPDKLTYKGSSLRGDHSSLRSHPRSSSEASKALDSKSTPTARLWAKRGDPDWECPICLKVGCPGCPGYMTDEELNASFDAAMRDTLDAGKPGLAQVASEAALKAANEDRKPSFYSLQLTPDREKRIDSVTGKIVDLPPLPHGNFCKCALCDTRAEHRKVSPQLPVQANRESTLSAPGEGLLGGKKDRHHHHGQR